MSGNSFLRLYTFVVLGCVVLCSAGNLQAQEENVYITVTPLTGCTGGAVPVAPNDFHIPTFHVEDNFVAEVRIVAFYPLRILDE